MTDKETSLAFVERMESVEIPSHSVLISREDFLHLCQIAKDAALIEEHRFAINYAYSAKGEQYFVESEDYEHTNANLSTAIRTVVAKIGEGK